MINLTKNAANMIGKMIGDRKEYGIRVQKVETCCSGLHFDLTFDRKKNQDRIIKRHNSIRVFADKDTLLMLQYLTKKKIMEPATIHFARTRLGPKFLTECGRVRLNLWSHEIV